MKAIRIFNSKLTRTRISPTVLLDYMKKNNIFIKSYDENGLREYSIGYYKGKFIIYIENPKQIILADANDLYEIIRAIQYNKPNSTQYDKLVAKLYDDISNYTPLTIYIRLK